MTDLETRIRRYRDATLARDIFNSPGPGRDRTLAQWIIAREQLVEFRNTLTDPASRAAINRVLRK